MWFGLQSVFPRNKRIVGKVSIKKRFVSHLKRGVWALIGCWFLQLQKNCKQLNAFIFSLIKQALNRAWRNLFQKHWERKICGGCVDVMEGSLLRASEAHPLSAARHLTMQHLLAWSQACKESGPWENWCNRNYSSLL